MAITMRQITYVSAWMNRGQSACAAHIGFARQAGTRKSCWSQHREASLNWLALGMLLAAWNASDHNPESPARRRPDSLRGYTSVSVRAAMIHFAHLHASSSIRTEVNS